jgi:hypothetical protein
MSRIRTIKPEFFLDDDLAELPPLTRLLFIGLWTLADCEGRLEDRPKRIRAQLHPFDDGDTDAMLQTLHDRRFIIRYVAQERRCIEVRNFKKHQRLSTKEIEGKSQLPQRDISGTHLGHTQDISGTYLGHNETIPDVQEGKGREWKGKEGNGREEPPEERAVALLPRVGTRAHEGGSSKISSKPKPAPISADWQPSAAALDVLATNGIAADFAMTCLPEFKLYWTERGDARPGWDASFVNSVKRSWEKRPMTDPATGRRPGQTRVERMMEQHARLFGPNSEPDPFAADPKLIEGECYVHH